MHIETLMLAGDSVCSHGDIAKTILRFPTEPFHRYSIQVTTSPDGVHLSPGRIVSMIPPFISLVLQRKNPGYCDACRKQSLLSSFSPLEVFSPAQEPRKWPGVADTFQMISLRELSINQSYEASDLRISWAWYDFLLGPYLSAFGRPIYRYWNAVPFNHWYCGLRHSNRFSTPNMSQTRI